MKNTVLIGKSLPVVLAMGMLTSSGVRLAAQDADVINQIRMEGIERSHVMDTLSYLTDVIGPRLTGSPNLRHANEWTAKTMEGWGMKNAHLEGWTFGRGWEYKRFSIQVVEPQDVPLKGIPSAWSGGLSKPLDAAPVILLGDQTDEQLKGKLKGAILFASPMRTLTPHFEPLATRLSDQVLATMGGSQGEATAGNAVGGGRGGARGGRGAVTPPPPGSLAFMGTTNYPGGGRGGRGGGGARGGGGMTPARMAFFAKEGVAMVVTCSTSFDQGTFVAQSIALASVPAPATTNAPAVPVAVTQDATLPTLTQLTNLLARAAITNDAVIAQITNALAGGGRGGFGGRGGRGGGGGRGMSAYSTNKPPVLPQVILAPEDYNRVVRMVEAGEKVKMAADLQVKYYDNDPKCYITVAEIPGTDPNLKDQIVMVGGHMDSWQAGTGATDNGCGVAAAMEAARIIKALNLPTKRTIRVALWSGEEEGLLGSRAYVEQHFGYYTNLPAAGGATNAAPAGGRGGGRGGRGGRGGGGRGGGGNRVLVKGPEYDKLSVYFNLDNGAGRIRGVYMQHNEASKALFSKWLEPFHDLGAETLTLQDTGSTDHVSFDNIGLPGFQFIQDPLEYGSRTHHSNEDVFDRVPPEDMKQASTILAAFLYHAANMDERFPRKPMADQ